MGGVMSISVKTTERGWGGHFICADRCLFRRNTLVEGPAQSFVVSTVGNFYDGREPVAQTIGHQRYYETMVFLARKDGPYLEADVGNQVFMSSDWSIDNVDKGSDNAANDMHEINVMELVEMIESGFIYGEES